ncbi:MAG: hypothetical protein GXO26_01815 [Crenarchaeota archaeon]|nr:hypothetical protein [Thermoproteota archaeon]
MWTVLYYIICRLYKSSRTPMIHDIIKLVLEQVQIFKNKDEIYHYIENLIKSKLIRVIYINKDELNEQTLLVPTDDDKCETIIKVVEETARRRITFFDEVIRQLVDAVVCYVNCSSF